MPYRYTTFNDVALPPRMTEEALGAPPAQSTIVDSLGGAVNYLGSNRFYPKRHPIAYRGIYVGEIAYLVDEVGNFIVDEAGNFIVASASAAARLRAQMDDIRSQIGRWARLVRRREEDTAEQFKYARLLAVDHVRALADTDRIARVDLSFEAEGRPWRSTTMATVSASLTANRTTAVAVVPGGTEEIRDAIITITPSSAITLTTIEMGGHHLRYTGAINLFSGIPNQLIIDCGAMTITNGGEDAFWQFSLDSDHTMPGWLTLGASNQIYITITGGGGTVTIDYYNQWA